MIEQSVKEYPKELIEKMVICWNCGAGATTTVEWRDLCAGCALYFS